MNPRVLEQGFDKDKKLWGGGAGIGAGKRPLPSERGLFPAPNFASGKKNKKAGGCLIAKK